MQDEKQGKMLLHTEHSLLSLLEGEEGVVQKHTSFVDTALQVYSFLVVKYHTKFNLQYLCKKCFIFLAPMTSVDCHLPPVGGGHVQIKLYPWII